MLVLSRKESETIVIPDGRGGLIELTIVEIRGDKVRLGFVAPDDTKIYRRELYDVLGLDSQANSALN